MLFSMFMVIVVLLKSKNSKANHDFKSYSNGNNRKTPPVNTFNLSFNLKNAFTLQFRMMYVT